MAHPNRLQGAHVLVFGGTSGIGYAIANMALSNGAHVTISGSNTPKLETKLASLRSNYPSLPPSQVTGFACDLADTSNLEANLKNVFEQATQGGQKKIDHIAFTAGEAVKLPPIANVEVNQILSRSHVRLLSVIFIAKLLAGNPGRYMPVSSRSSFTLTSGSNTAKPKPGWTIAAAWGAAVEGLTRGLAVDLKPIRVNCVSMGAIETPLLEGFRRNGGEEQLKLFVEGTLVGDFGQPEDTAEAYAWCMRDRYVTGIVAQTDGGRMLCG